MSQQESVSPLIVGVAGGSCSGKTTLIKLTQKLLGDSICSVIYQDSYYRDQSSKFDHDGGSVNFDHPESIDFEYLYLQLIQMKQGRSVNVPIYEFATHKRLERTELHEPAQLILIDGILIFTDEKIRQLLDYRVFITCDEDIRLKRRIARDVAERGRTEQGVISQFRSQVSPMHELFVEPSKNFADIVITQEQLGEYLKSDTNPITSFLNSKTPSY